MKFIRKALWPTAIVAAFLMLFGALGSAVNADSVKGTIQKDGDTIYVVVGVTGDPDNEGPDADQTALAKAKTDADAAKVDADAAKKSADAIVRTVGNALTITEVRQAAADAIDVAVAVVAANKKVIAAAKKVIAAAILVDDRKDDRKYEASANVSKTASNAREAARAANGQPSAKIAHGHLVSATSLLSQEAGAVAADAAIVADIAAINAAVNPAPAAQKYSVAITDGSGNANIGSSNTAVVTPALADGEYRASVEVECVTAGSYNISFTNVKSHAVVDADFACPGPGPGYVDVVNLSASKSTVGTSGSSASTVITATLVDDDGDAAKAGDSVIFTTDNCVFGNGKAAQTERSEADGDDTIAEVTLDCSKGTPGVATVTVIGDRPGRDVSASMDVTVIGSPASLTVDATSMMENMACGEVAKLTITVVDSADQPVANGTVVNLTTNIAGVLVAPANTSGGVATAYLITSNASVGSYAVVVQSGSAIGYVTVTCGVEMEMDADGDADAPSITPPNTGDAGLAETSGSSWMLLAIAGALASVMVAVGKGMPLFFRRS